MSQYLNFFIRNGSTFIPFASYCRSSDIYSAFSEAPYEKVRKITTTDLDCAEEYFEDLREAYEKHIHHYESELDFLRSCAQPLSDVLAQRDDVVQAIKETECELDDTKYGSSFVQFLRNMIINFKYTDPDLPQEQKPALYMGIECGSTIASEDILD